MHAGQKALQNLFVRTRELRSAVCDGPNSGWVDRNSIGDVVIDCVAVETKAPLSTGSDGTHVPASHTAAARGGSKSS